MKIVLTAAPELENAGKYKKLHVAYSSDGKESNKTLVSFGDGKPVYDMLTKASVGDSFDITVRNDGKYWNWISAKQMESSGELPPSRPRKSYEGDTERQVSIIKQSCLKCAAEFHSGLANKENAQAVLTTAEIFYRWVNAPLIEVPVEPELDQEVV